ncbi:MAG: type II toxin-antitoxin system prevent-host-death family antitoxin [Cytophagales bacterium]|nr:type II toxin-antitoxin system prevent-host-death family antitoxin [Cytophagales bacterium]
MINFAVRDLREHTGELVRNAESGEYSVVSKHGKPLFVAVPFNDALLASGVNVALADNLVKRGDISIAAGAKLAMMPRDRYMRHLGQQGYSFMTEDNFESELANDLKHLSSLRN